VLERVDVETNIKWIRESLERIEKKVDKLDGK